MAGNGKEAGSLQVRVLNIFRGPIYVFGPVLALFRTLYTLYAPYFAPRAPPSPSVRRLSHCEAGEKEDFL